MAARMRMPLPYPISPAFTVVARMRMSKPNPTLLYLSILRLLFGGAHAHAPTLPYLSVQR